MEEEEEEEEEEEDGGGKKKKFPHQQISYSKKADTQRLPKHYYSLKGATIKFMNNTALQ